jgi:hypothetical protein
MCLQFMVTARPFRNRPQGASRVLRFTEDGVASEPKKETFNILKRSLEQRSGGGGGGRGPGSSDQNPATLCRKLYI